MGIELEDVNDCFGIPSGFLFGNSGAGKEFRPLRWKTLNISCIMGQTERFTVNPPEIGSNPTCTWCTKFVGWLTPISGEREYRSSIQAYTSSSVLKAK
jgi:hypothetical protein